MPHIKATEGMEVYLASGVRGDSPLGGEGKGMGSIGSQEVERAGCSGSGNFLPHLFIPIWDPISQDAATHTQVALPS